MFLFPLLINVFIGWKITKDSYYSLPGQKSLVCPTNKSKPKDFIFLMIMWSNKQTKNRPIGQRATEQPDVLLMTELRNYSICNCKCRDKAFKNLYTGDAVDAFHHHMHWLDISYIKFFVFAASQVWCRSFWSFFWLKQARKLLRIFCITVSSCDLLHLCTYVYLVHTVSRTLHCKCCHSCAKVMHSILT